MMTHKRNVILYLILMIATVLCGLLSRSHCIPQPAFIATYAGDTLWALMVFFGVCIVLRRRLTWEIVMIALVFSFAIEFSQLYQAPWINSIRHTRIGGLVLGYGFKYSDLICYSVGVLLGVFIDQLLQHRNKHTDNA